MISLKQLGIQKLADLCSCINGLRRRHAVTNAHEMPAQTNRRKREAQHDSLTTSINTAFDPSSPAHLEQLERLWHTAWPHLPYEGLKAEQWCELGFQRSEPVSDFRGAGLQGVKNLIFFLEHRHDEFQQAVASGETHNLAVSGLAVTMLLRGYLELHEPGQRLMPVVQGDELRAPAAVRRRFVAWLANDETALMEMHAIFVSSLQHAWREARAAGWNLLDFPILLTATRDHIARTLPRALAPLSAAQLATLSARYTVALDLRAPPPHTRAMAGGRGAASRYRAPTKQSYCAVFFCPLPQLPLALAFFTVHQLSKMALNESVGLLTTVGRSNVDEAIDGVPLAVGVHVILEQAHSNRTEAYVGYMLQYLRALVCYREPKATDAPEVSVLLEYMRIFCDWARYDCPELRAFPQ